MAGVGNPQQTDDRQRMTARPPLLPTYSEYKPSGIPWLGDIPAHWETRRLKYVARIIGGATPSSIVPEYWDGDITWITPQDLGKLTSPYIHEGARRITRKGYESCGTKTAPAGSIVLSTRAPIGHVAILKNPACVNQGCRLLIPNSTIHSEYLYYTLKSVRANHELESLGQGSTFMELSRMKLASLKVPLPPPEEQAAIARYLTHKDALIHRFLQGKQRMLDLLKQLRKSTIHYAVVHGLDPKNTPMKPSGIPWIDEIPAHWETRRLKYVAEMRTSNVDKHVKEDELPVRLCNYVDVYKNDFITQDIDFMRATASEKEIEKFRLNRNDVIITKDSETWNDIAVPALVTEPADDLICGYHLALLRPKDLMLGGYLFRVLQSQVIAHQFFIEAHGVIRYGLSQHAIKSVRLPVPPLEEQAAIAEYLDDRIAKIDAAIAVTIRIIDQMRQYRKSLIHEVVTGVRDVRKAAAAIPDDPDGSHS